MKAVAYLRFSPRPESTDSLEVQHGCIERYCASMGIEVAAVFMDPETSARKTCLQDRKGGAAMFRYMKEHGVKDIVCKCLDRMFRNTVDGLTMTQKFEKDGTTVHFAQSRTMLDATSAINRLILTTMLGVAQFEPEMTAERTSDALKAKRDRGERVGRYATFVGSERSEELLPLVRELSETLTNRGIARELERREIPGPTGRGWSHNTIGKMLV